MQLEGKAKPENQQKHISTIHYRRKVVFLPEQTEGKANQRRHQYPVHRPKILEIPKPDCLRNENDKEICTDDTDSRPGKTHQRCG